MNVTRTLLDDPRLSSAAVPTGRNRSGELPTAPRDAARGGEEAQAGKDTAARAATEITSVAISRVRHSPATPPSSADGKETLSGASPLGRPLRPQCLAFARHCDLPPNQRPVTLTFTIFE